MCLMTSLKEWTDIDLSMYHLACSLGILDPNKHKFKTHAKRILCSNNKYSAMLEAMLMDMAKTGILMYRDEPDHQFKWNDDLDISNRRPIIPHIDTLSASEAEVIAVKLHDAAKANNSEAINYMILMAMPKIRRMAMLYNNRNYNNSIDDYINEAVCCIVRYAIPKWDPDKGKWIPYAMNWSRSAMSDIAFHNRVINLKIREKNRLNAYLANSGMDVQDAIAMQNGVRTFFSDQVVNHVPSSDVWCDQEYVVETNQIIDRMRSMIDDVLIPRNARVMHDILDGASVVETAKKYGMTPQNVSIIYKNCVLQLRKSMRIEIPNPDVVTLTVNPNRKGNSSKVSHDHIRNISYNFVRGFRRPVPMTNILQHVKKKMKGTRLPSNLKEIISSDDRIINISDSTSSKWVSKQ